MYSIKQYFICEMIVDKKGSINDNELFGYEIYRLLSRLDSFRKFEQTLSQCYNGSKVNFNCRINLGDT